MGLEPVPDGSRRSAVPPRRAEVRRVPGCAAMRLAADAGGPDPAVGSAGVSTRQARFEGSDRQARGRLMKALSAGPVSRSDVASVMQRDEETRIAPGRSADRGRNVSGGLVDDPSTQLIVSAVCRRHRSLCAWSPSSSSVSIGSLPAARSRTGRKRFAPRSRDSPSKSASAKSTSRSSRPTQRMPQTEEELEWSRHNDWVEPSTDEDWSRLAVIDQGDIWLVEEPDEQAPAVSRLTRARAIPVLNAVTDRAHHPNDSRHRHRAPPRSRAMECGVSASRNVRQRKDRSVSVYLTRHIGHIAPGRWHEVCEAMRIAIGC